MSTPWPELHFQTAADLAACRTLLRNGSRTFYAASFLLPRRIRLDATALYAFCRLADDAVDLGDASTQPLRHLQDRLQRAAEGQPRPLPSDRALAAVMAWHDIPLALPAGLLEGFAWDAAGLRYATLEDLEAYAARVAGTVGAMMALLMGQRDPQQLARAADLGVAMQLTNIARDVGEDARNGRLYLPLRWMAEAGLNADHWLRDPHFSPALGSVVKRLLEAAERHYKRADDGIAGLPLDCRPGIAAARLLYAEIGQMVARNGYDSVSRRAVVSPARKCVLLIQAMMQASLPGRREAHPVLEANRFILDSVAVRTLADIEENAVSLPPWWDIGSRTTRIIDLFARLERRQQGRV